MFSSERNELRQVFFTTWQKHLNKSPLEPLEAQVLEIILHHPEYHDLLSHPEQYQDKDFPETNPFLHMSLHIALHEQISTNRPAGIREIYTALILRNTDAHEAEHKMVECLGEIIWEAQRNGIMPDETIYLEKLKKL